MARFTSLQLAIMDALDAWVSDEQPRFAKGSREYRTLVDVIEAILKKRGVVDGAHSRGGSCEVGKVEEGPGPSPAPRRGRGNHKRNH